MHVTVVYAHADRQSVVAVELAPGASVQEAIERSGLIEANPELRSRDLAVGIYYRRCNLGTRLRDGDRVEIYRPLQIDPMQARRLRAAKKARPASDDSGNGT